MALVGVVIGEGEGMAEGMALVEAEGLVMAWAAILAATTSARIAKRKTLAGLRFPGSHRFIGTPNFVRRGGSRFDP